MSLNGRDKTCHETRMQKCLSVPCRAPLPAQDSQKESKKRPAGHLLSAYRAAKKWSALQELCCFPRGRSHRTLPISIQRDTEVAATLLGSLCDTPFGQAIPRARDLARMDLELLLNLLLSETRPTSEASSRHPSRTANAKTFSDASEQLQTTSQRRLQSLRKRHRILPKLQYQRRREKLLREILCGVGVKNVHKSFSMTRAVGDRSLNCQRTKHAASIPTSSSPPSVPSARTRREASQPPGYCSTVRTVSR